MRSRAKKSIKSFKSPPFVRLMPAQNRLMGPPIGVGRA